MKAHHFQTGVIIATSFNRTDLLFNRSLSSVLKQTYSPDYIVIVDDNLNENEFEIVADKITQLNNPNIFCIRNFKTKHNSGTGAWNSEKIVLAMPLHNGAATIRRAVLSIINQKNVRRKLMLVIGNDNSTDGWQQAIEDLITDNIIIINIVNGEKSYKVRNAINNYILNNLENVAYIGRLDADDELADESVISKLEQIINSQCPDVIVAGNYQRNRTEITGTNIPDKNLLIDNYLIERLHKMSLDVFEAELPSCNTFVKPESIIKYPPKESAEDHWFLVELLLKKDRLKIHIAEDIIYSIYSVAGNLTKKNKANEEYIRSRKELYEYLKNKINEQKR